MKREGEYIILKLTEMGVEDYMKDQGGNIIYYPTQEEAYQSCWINELEDATIVKIVQRYQEPNLVQDLDKL
jgi:hypothetical protein